MTELHATCRTTGVWHYSPGTPEDQARYEAKAKRIHGGTWWLAGERVMGRIEWDEATRQIQAARVERHRRRAAARSRP